MVGESRHLISDSGGVHFIAGLFDDSMSIEVIGCPVCLPPHIEQQSRVLADDASLQVKVISDQHSAFMNILLIFYFFMENIFSFLFELYFSKLKYLMKFEVGFQGEKFEHIFLIVTEVLTFFSKLPFL